MLNNRRIAIVLPALLSAAVAACGGDDTRENDPAPKPVDGTFVGEVSKSDAFVAVVAEPAARGKNVRPVSLYVSDGGRLSESLTGSLKDNGFTATSDDDKAKARGRLQGDTVSGTLTLSGGKEVSYRATRATAAAGLYELTVSAKGRMSGASANGVGLTSRSSLRAPGFGKIRFADGRQRRFELTTDAAPDPVRLGAGQLRVIVTPDGEMSGAGAAKAGGKELELFIRSAGR
jgi:hypothetical protein